MLMFGLRTPRDRAVHPRISATSFDVQSKRYIVLCRLRIVLKQGRPRQAGHSPAITLALTAFGLVRLIIPQGTYLPFLFT